MKTEQAFKLKSKILSKAKSIKISESNELLAKLFGFSSYYEYKKSLNKNDGRHVFAQIHKDNKTFSQLRIKSLLEKSQKIGLSQQELFKVFNIKDMHDLLKKDFVEGDFKNPYSYVLKDKTKLLIGKESKYNLIKYKAGTGSGFLKAEIIKEIKKKNKRVMFISHKVVGYSILRDFTDNKEILYTPHKIYNLYKKGELGALLANFDIIVFDLYEKMLLRRIDLMNLLKTKKMYVFFEDLKMFEKINYSYFQSESFVEKYGKSKSIDVELLDSIYHDKKANNFVEFESLNKNLGVGKKILKDTFRFLLLVNFYKENNQVSLTTHDIYQRNSDPKYFRDLLMDDKDLKEDVLIKEYTNRIKMNEDLIRWSEENSLRGTYVNFKMKEGKKSDRNLINEVYNKYNYVIKVAEKEV